MDFISVAYLGFLGILIILYYVIPKNRQWVLLLVFGIFFYSCFSLKMWIFLLFTAITTYLYALFFSGSKKWLLGITGMNVLILLGLKLSASGLSFVRGLGIERFSILLPVGISFYTLQTIAYMADVHKGRTKAQKNFLDRKSVV